MDTFLSFYDGIENELVCVTFNRTFQSLYNKEQHISKPTWSPNDLVSVALRYVYKLVEDGEVDFINTRLNSGNVDNDDVSLSPFFSANVQDYPPISFEKGWALRAGYGKRYGCQVH